MIIPALTPERKEELNKLVDKISEMIAQAVH